MKRHLLALCIALVLGVSALTTEAGGHGGGCWGGHGCGGGWCGRGCGWGGCGWGGCGWGGVSFGVGFGFGFPVAYAAPAPVFVQPAPAFVAVGVSTPVVRTVATVPVAYYSRPTTTVVAQRYYTSVPTTTVVARRYYTSVPTTTVAAVAPTPAQIRSSSGTWVLDSTPYRYPATATASQVSNSSATTVVRPAQATWTYVASR